jgi:hypothetical protein
VVRDAYVTSLAKFTTLDTVREMSAVNLLCIRTLLHVAYTDGDWLHDSWAQLLQVVSQLARLQMLNEGLSTDDQFFGAGGDGGGAKKGGGFFSGPSREEREKEQRESSIKAIEASNAAQIAAHVRERDLDRIFTSSAQLNGSAIYSFVKELCAMSLAEVAQGDGSGAGSVGSYGVRGSAALLPADQSQPRVYSLQKLVEVASFNMDCRPRVLWARVWSLLGAHFEWCGCHNNTAVAFFAVDSLKQLTLKFLLQEESPVYKYQRQFLRPFEVIMSRAGSAEVKELLMQCIGRIMLARAANIQVPTPHSFLQLEFGLKIFNPPTCCLPTYLPTYLSTYLPAYLPTYLPTYHLLQSGWATLFNTFTLAATDSSAGGGTLLELSWEPMDAAMTVRRRNPAVALSLCGEATGVRVVLSLPPGPPPAARRPPPAARRCHSRLSLLAPRATRALPSRPPAFPSLRPARLRSASSPASSHHLVCICPPTVDHRPRPQTHHKPTHNPNPNPRGCRTTSPSPAWARTSWRWCVAWWPSPRPAARRKSLWRPSGTCRAVCRRSPLATWRVPRRQPRPPPQAPPAAARAAETASRTGTGTGTGTAVRGVAVVVVAGGVAVVPRLRQRRR